MFHVVRLAALAFAVVVFSVACSDSKTESPAATNPDLDAGVPVDASSDSISMEAGLVDGSAPRASALFVFSKASGTLLEGNDFAGEHVVTLDHQAPELFDTLPCGTGATTVTEPGVVSVAGGICKGGVEMTLTVRAPDAKRAAGDVFPYGPTVDIGSHTFQARRAAPDEVETTAVTSNGDGTTTIEGSFKLEYPPELSVVGTFRSVIAR